MIQCPECRNMIPDDSAFCDQCGKELMWCPECKRPKRGSECPVCGSDLIPGRKYLAGGASSGTSGAGGASGGSGASSSQAGSGSSQSTTQPPVNQPQGTSAQPMPQGTSAGPAPSAWASRLVGNGWSLTLREGGFGRNGGIWTELNTIPYVSGSHGRIERRASDWIIIDNGSTNGTFINGARIAPGVGTPLHKGDKVKIATVEFTVE